MGDISDKLEYLSDTKDAIKQAIIDKGVDVQASDTFRSYATKIGDIKSIGIPREISSNVFQTPREPFVYTIPDSVTKIDNFAFAYAFVNSNITELDLTGVTEISGSGLQNVCQSCAYLTSVKVPNVSNCNYSSVFSNAFNSCVTLTSVTFPALSGLNGTQCFNQAFSYCNRLTSISFPALTSTSFGSNTSQFYRMLYRTTGCTVHFPSNLQSVIGSWSDVTAGFNGTNTVVLFDLPATT